MGSVRGWRPARAARSSSGAAPAAASASPHSSSAPDAAPPPPLAIAGLRRGLPAWPVGLDALPDALLVHARGGRGRPAARPLGAEEGGGGGGCTQPDQAPAPRALARTRGGAAGGPGLRPDRPAWPGRGGRG